MSTMNQKRSPVNNNIEPEELQVPNANSGASSQALEQVRSKMKRNSRNYSSSNDWFQEIRNRQQQFVTPEIRAEMSRKQARSRRIGKKKKRANLYQRAAVMSKNAWAQGNVRALRSAPSQQAESANYSNMQQMRIQEVYNHRGFAEEEDDEEQLEMALDTLTVEQNEDKIQVNANEMGQVLSQLRTEPKVASEVEAKFELYSNFLKTVEDSRKATFDFWKECKEEFTEQSGVGNAVNQVEQDIRNIDKEENLSIHFHPNRWFVYDMTQKADSNNTNIKNVLTNIERKLELLKNDDDCPFCLEALSDLDQNEVHTLGCCHKSCKDCWNNWKNLKGNQAFCPLCRQTDFLGAMC